VIENPTVLLVDDEESLVIALRDELQKEGYNVLTASNGEEGLAIVRSHQPSVIVLDIRMPLLDGKQVLQIVKKEFPNIKVIMLTSHGDLISAMECKALGADDFIEKPYEMGDLFASIRYVMKT